MICVPSFEKSLWWSFASFQSGYYFIAVEGLTTYNVIIIYNMQGIKILACF